MNHFAIKNFTKLSVLLVLVFISQLTIIHQGPRATAALTPTDQSSKMKTEKMVPVGPTVYRSIDATSAIDGGRRKLAPFQLCLLCKCCSGSTCASMPCCFGISCQLPNKPFGVCAFVPKTCNCTTCATK